MEKIFTSTIESSIATWILPKVDSLQNKNSNIISRWVVARAAGVALAILTLGDVGLHVALGVIKFSASVLYLALNALHHSNKYKATFRECTQHFTRSIRCLLAAVTALFLGAIQPNKLKGVYVWFKLSDVNKGCFNSTCGRIWGIWTHKKNLLWGAVFLSMTVGMGAMLRRRPSVIQSWNHLGFTSVALALPCAMAIATMRKKCCKNKLENPYQRSTREIQEGQLKGRDVKKDLIKNSSLGYDALVQRWTKYCSSIAASCSLVMYIAMFRNEPAEFLQDALTKFPGTLNSSSGLGRFPDNTPLIWAIANANNDAAFKLLDLHGSYGLGLDLDKQSDGNTALLLAVRKGHRNRNAACIPLTHSNVQIAQKLLKMNANPNLKDNEGNTALHLAYLRREKDVIALLKSYGAREDLLNNRNLSPTEMSSLPFTEVRQILGDRTAVSLDIW